MAYEWNKNYDKWNQKKPLAQGLNSTKMGTNNTSDPKSKI